MHEFDHQKFHGNYAIVGRQSVPNLSTTVASEEMDEVRGAMVVKKECNGEKEELARLMLIV